MNKSESIGQIAKALSLAQASMGSAKKDSSNPFFKSKYSDLAAVVEAIKKPLADNGLSYAQVTDIDDNGIIVETVLMHESGEWLSGRLRMRPVKDDPQGIGSCVTYARRYGLQAMVGVPSDDDDGNAASGNADKTPAKKPFEKPHKPVDGAFESLPKDRQVFVRDLAIEIIAFFAQKDIHSAHRKSLEVEGDELIALWSQLDSPIRTAIKKYDKEFTEQAA